MLSPCKGPAPHQALKKITSSFSDLVHTHQIRPESLSVFPPWPLLRIHYLYNVSSTDKLHRAKRFLLSVTRLFCISGLQRGHSASLLSPTQRGACKQFAAQDWQSASQLQTKPRAEFAQDSRSGWQERSQRGSVRGSGECSSHSHTLAREAAEHDAVQLGLTRVTVKKGVTKEDTDHPRL